MTFTFRPLALTDLPLLEKWHRLPHVKEWWGDESLEDIITEYTDKLDDSLVDVYIVEHQSRDIAMLQTYDAFGADEGWWPDEPEGTFGLDCFIGEPDLLEKGLGSALVREMAETLLKRSDVTRLIIDPDPKNARAIRAYEKAGFVKQRVIETPDGPAHYMVWSRP